MSHPKFQIFTDKGGKFRFNLTARNGKIILASEAYNSTAARKNGIESVKKNSGDTNRFERAASKKGQPYFNLKAGNGEVIGKSEMYSSSSARSKGIASVMKNAAIAGVEEK